MTKFKQFERYKTRNGGTALILEACERHLLAAHFNADGKYSGLIMNTLDGRYGGGGHDILPPEPEKMACWPNIYKAPDDGGLYILGRLHQTKADADQNAMPDRVGRHRIELRAEFEDE